MLPEIWSVTDTFLSFCTGFFVILGKLIVNKCTFHWNNLQKILKQNLQMMKRSNLKTNVRNYFLTA